MTTRIKTRAIENDAVTAAKIATDAVAVHAEPFREKWVRDACPRSREQTPIALIVLDALLVREHDHPSRPSLRAG